MARRDTRKLAKGRSRVDYRHYWVNGNSRHTHHTANYSKIKGPKRGDTHSARIPLSASAFGLRLSPNPGVPLL